jgi:hypothetical protein
MSVRGERFVTIALLLPALRTELYTSYLRLDDFDRQPWTSRNAGLPVDIEGKLRQLAARIAGILDVARDAEGEGARAGAVGAVGVAQELTE